MSDTRSLDFAIQDILFQDTRIITLRLTADGNPLRFDVSLESINNASLLPVYSAPVPYSRSIDGRTVIFHLGEYPPNPLSLEIVVPKYFEGMLGASALYDKWDDYIDPGNKPVTDDYLLKTSRSIKL